MLRSEPSVNPVLRGYYLNLGGFSKILGGSPRILEDSWRILRSSCSVFNDRNNSDV